MTFQEGYYRHPAVYKDRIVFVSEDDLWIVPKAGGIARRLTTGLGAVTTPVFSPDGERIAFAGTDEGHQELYIIPAEGGSASRVTYLGCSLTLSSWVNEGILFACSYAQPFLKWNEIWLQNPEGGVPRRLPTGPANFISVQKGLKGPATLQRHGYREYGFWKRYRGGTAGEIWVDAKGDGSYQKFLNLKSDLARPLFIKDRVYFLSDHEGVGNIYSAKTDGSDLKRHTKHVDYYARNIATDGDTIVYHAGGDLYTFDLETEEVSKVDIKYYGPRTQRNRKFASAARYLEDFTLHPKGHHLSVTSRGKAFSFGNWEGPVLQLGVLDGVRYRLPEWLADGKRVLLVHDKDGEEKLEIYDAEAGSCLSTSPHLKLGRVVDIKISPKKDEAVLTNHRSELIHIDLKKWKTKLIERSEFSAIRGFDWSPCGEWVAYSASLTRRATAIKLYNTKSGKITQATKPILRDIEPSFDPEGKYLYFISYRDFDPVWDAMHFEMGFPRGSRPYLLTLQKDLTSPFLQKPSDLIEKEDKGEEKEDQKKDKKDKKKEIQKTKIDLEGIQERLLAFPVELGLYSQVTGLKGRAAFIYWPVEGTLEADFEAEEGPSDGILESYDFDTQKLDEIADGVAEVITSHDRCWIGYRSEQRLRILKADEKPDDRSVGEKPSRKSGWIDLARIRLSVNPVFEWDQMYKEAWRLQRDHFWTEDMSSIDWKRVYDRYYELITRVSTRGEFSDVLWEMQGELGTSHAYVMGGDYRRPPRYSVGLLGAEFRWNEKFKAYEISHIAKGDHWRSKNASPFAQPGVNVKEGDLLYSINGRSLSGDVPPESFLVYQAGLEVALEVSEAKGKNRRRIIAKTMEHDLNERYRDWVEKNRTYVHKKTKGRVGYIHIPNMGPQGFAEFHRSYLRECDYEGLIVDVRFNGGGNVSSLLLEKLARKRLGYDWTRWFGTSPYPDESPVGPMVALTNEYAGSDGDMFSHAFKMMKLGPLLGKRTWGGVIGIWPRHPLVDGGMTTQPEFSFWFKDVGWNIENYGVDPDIEIEITPQEYAAGKDPQLERSIEEVLQIMKENPPELPDLKSKPSLALPKKLAQG